jgi:WD repeat-containing protein 24
VRTVKWRPDYECELAVVSNASAGTGSGSDGYEAPVEGGALGLSNPSSGVPKGRTDDPSVGGVGIGDPVEIWDVRRGWIAKWRVGGSAAEGGVYGKFLLFWAVLYVHSIR